MNIHVWEAPGWGEGIDGGCSVKKFTISEMSDDYAEGEITIIDGIEGGITFTEPWEASINFKSSGVNGTYSTFEYPRRPLLEDAQ